MDWSKPPRVVAHRGASREAPENTRAAFERALAHTPAIELDVHLTRDGVPVVLHDADLGRTTSGRGLVNALSAAEVTRLVAGRGAFVSERVPALDDVLAAFGPRALLDVEMKPGKANAALPEKVGRLVLARGLASRVLLTSFDLDLVHEAKVRWPEVRAGVVSGVPLSGEEVADVARYADALVLAHNVVDAATLAAAKRQGLVVLAWTVNDADVAKRLWAMGVDAVVTDDPAALARVAP